MFNCKLKLSLRAGYSIGDVYEVASWSSANGHTFDQAMEGWKSSHGHNVVIRGINEWAKNTKNGGCWASGKFVNCYFSAGVESPKTSSESVIAMSTSGIVTPKNSLEDKYLFKHNYPR